MNVLVLAWATLGLLMLAVELFNPGLFFALSMAIGALGGAFGAGFGAMLETQVLLVIALSFLAFIALSVLLARFGFSKTISKKEATNVDALVGQIAIALSSFHFFEKGTVKVGGEVWSAVNHGNLSISFGDKVKIIKIEGNRLFVLKVEGGQ